MPLAKSLSRPALVGNSARWILGVALALCGASALSADVVQHDAKVDVEWRWNLPPGFPEPLVPASNPMNRAKVRLGEMLFVERGLSVNGKLSCADCHHPQNYFVDNVVTPTGALGEALPFNTPTLINSAYSTSFSWTDKSFTELEQQHLGPLTNTQPVELGTGPKQLAALQARPEVAAALAAAFPESTGLELDLVVAALASYVRTLIRGGSTFDDYLFNDQVDALSEEARRGLALFTSSRLNCASCHRGFLLSGPTRSAREAFPPSFYRTGLMTGLDTGSSVPLAFRAPSLRFIAHTAPYMHDGRFASLDAVLDFYQSGGESDAQDEKAAARMAPFLLKPAERRALLAFLKSL